MATIWIVILLMVPVVGVIAALNISHKKQQQKADKRISVYLQQIMEQTGLINSFQKNLSHQLVILDDVNRKLLVIDHVDQTYSHTLYELDDIKGIEVINKRVMAADERNKKAAGFTSQVGLEIIPADGSDPKKLLVFYDHLKHSVYLMAEMEQEAKQLGQRIKEAKTKKQIVA